MGRAVPGEHFSAEDRCGRCGTHLNPDGKIYGTTGVGRATSHRLCFNEEAVVLRHRADPGFQKWLVASLSDPASHSSRTTSTRSE